MFIDLSKRISMNGTFKFKALKIALFTFGLIFALGIFPLMMFWPAGWRWTPNQTEYEQMILGIYVTLGIFLMIASRNPLEHKSLIWFTVWSSFVHAGIMTFQAVAEHAEFGHLLGDVPALYLVAIVLAALMPKNNTIS